MTTYQQFVKSQMTKMRSSRLTPQQKMKKIGQLWRQSGHKATTGKRKATKATKGRKGRRGGSNLGLSGGSLGLSGGRVALDNGVPLHPAMMGSGFWKDFARGFKMPFQAVADVAMSPVGKTALAVAPFLL